MKGCISQAKDKDGKPIRDKWILTYDIPPPPGQQRKVKRETVNGPKKKAQARMSEILQGLNTGAYTEPTELTAGRMANVVAGEIREGRSCPSEATRCTRRTSCTHVIPKLGRIKLHQLGTEDLQGLYVALLTEPSRRTQKPLAPATVARIRSVVSDALNQAVANKKLHVNPNSGVKLPANLKTSRTREMVVYTEEQLNTLLDAAKDSTLHTEVLLGATTGMRLGEVLALKWDDIDWERKTVRVDEATEFSQAKGNRLKGPKSESGKRIIPLMGYAVEPLRRHRIQQTAYRSETDASWNPTGLVCPRKDGGLQAVATVSSYFDRFAKRLAKATGLPEITFHQLRHTYASLMLHQGTQITEVSRLLGHSSIIVTLGIYAHLIPGADSAAVDRFDERLRQARG
jgi:integrase